MFDGSALLEQHSNPEASKKHAKAPISDFTPSSVPAVRYSSGLDGLMVFAEDTQEEAASKEYDVDEKSSGPKKITDIKTRKDFKDPKEAYRHVKKLDSDIPRIKKRNLNISKTEVDMTKKNVREWFPEDEYPGIDY